MNPPISKKLLVLLGVTLVAAAFGARSLLSMSGSATESGFDGAPPLPLSGTSNDDLPPYEIGPLPNPRNPFALVGFDAEELGTNDNGGADLPEP